MLNPKIELEQHLTEQIYAALHGELVEKIVSLSSFDQSSHGLRSAMEGHSFKVEKRLMGHLYDLLYGVKEKLGFKDVIQIATAMYTEDGYKPTIILDGQTLIGDPAQAAKYCIGYDVR